MSKTIKIVRKPAKTVKVVKPAKKSAPKYKVNGRVLPLGKVVNVKVAGERVMRKNVILVAHPLRENTVQVRTGSRGRPSNLPVEQIERVRAL